MKNKKFLYVIALFAFTTGVLLPMFAMAAPKSPPPPARPSGFTNSNIASPEASPARPSGFTNSNIASPEASPIRPSGFTNDLVLGEPSNNNTPAQGLTEAKFNSINIGRDNDISSYAAGVGIGNEVRGSTALANGLRNKVTGLASFVSGMDNRVTGKNSISSGVENDVSGFNSFANGYKNIVNGFNSFAIGFLNKIGESADRSMVGGVLNTVSGSDSFASGFQNTVEGYRSFASGAKNSVKTPHTLVTGVNNTVYGANSLVGGSYINAQAFNSAVFGRYNVESDKYNPSNWIGTDPLFVIGNGNGSKALSNAMTVLKNGKVGIGTASPKALLSVESPVNCGKGDILAEFKGKGPGSGYVRIMCDGSIQMTGSVTKIDKPVSPGSDGGQGTTPINPGEGQGTTPTNPGGSASIVSPVSKFLDIPVVISDQDLPEYEPNPKDPSVFDGVPWVGNVTNQGITSNEGVGSNQIGGGATFSP